MQNLIIFMSFKATQFLSCYFKHLIFIESQSKIIIENFQLSFKIIFQVQLIFFVVFENLSNISYLSLCETFPNSY